ncbi:unnamed protein product, partial [Ascophyllum nodosum]
GHEYSRLGPEQPSSCQYYLRCKLPQRLIVISLSLLVLGAMIVVIALGTNRWRQNTFDNINATWPEQQPDGGFSLLAMSVQVYNAYREEGSIKLYPWEHVAEPHRTTMLGVTSWSREALSSEVEFRWKIDGVSAGSGSSVDVVFSSPGFYECSVSAIRTAPSGASGAKPAVIRAREGNVPPVAPAATEEIVAVEHSFNVTVKYVRREVRSLTDFDREKFFNAVSVLQRVPSAVGQQVYGKKYYSKDFFNRLHLYYGGRKDCDHWHDGAGFVTSHIAISLMFEQSLQAVDPSITLPYWDFTVEGTEYDWTNFRSSSVFADDWFGTAAPRNGLRTPNRGRFAYVPTMTDAREYSELYNPYGLLRSPWNTDPNPVLTRHDYIFGYPNNRKPSGCKQYRDAVHQTSWMDLTQSLNAGAHGHIHELMGGAWSADWHDFDERTSEIIFPFMHNIVPYMKFLWRSGHLECVESCAADVPWRDCQCTCANLEAVSKMPSQVLEEAGLLNKSVGLLFYDKDMKLIEKMGNQQDQAFTVIPGYSKEETADIYHELLSLLCTPMKIGTHYEGASTNDITFWVIHPAFDRLWHLRRLRHDPDFDETWFDDHFCYGHNPNDVQPFHDLFGDSHRDIITEDSTNDALGNSTGTVEEVQAPKKYHTNIELYNLLQPDGMAIPYMYDNFLWSHCEVSLLIKACL